MLYIFVLSCRLLSAVLSGCIEYLELSHRKYGQLRQTVVKLLDDMWVLWKKSREAAQMEAIEAESLYRWRVKDCDIEAQDEEEIKELLEDHFPSYDNFFSNSAFVDGNSSLHSASKLEKKSLMLKEADILSVCVIHMLLHDRTTLPQSQSTSSFLQLYEVSSILHSHLGLIPGKYNM